METSEWEAIREDAVATLSRYLQFDTTNPPGNEVVTAGFGPFVLELSEIDRVHGVDERISIENLGLGVKIACDVIRELCVA